MGLLYRIARRVHRDVGAHVELDELVSLGMAGLLEAERRYDIDRGTAFAAFAHYRIRGAIYDGLRTMGALPRRLYRQAVIARRTDDYTEHLQARSQAARQPGTAARQPLTLEHAHALHDAVRNVAAIYITALAGEQQESTIADPRQVPTDEQLARKQRGARLRQAIATLPEREAHLIERCYFDGATLSEAGAELGLSRSWTSRLHARAVRRLRAALDDDR